MAAALSEDQPLTRLVAFRASPTLYAALATEAERRQQSLSEWIRDSVATRALASDSPTNRAASANRLGSAPEATGARL